MSLHGAFRYPSGIPLRLGIKPGGELLEQNHHVLSEVKCHFEGPAMHPVIHDRQQEQPSRAVIVTPRPQRLPPNHAPGRVTVYYPSAGMLSSWLRLLAGVGLATGLAGVAIALRQWSGIQSLSPLILAVLLGIGVKNTVGVPAACHPGITFALKRLLRLAIILLGLQLSAVQLIEVGPISLLIVAVTLTSTFVFTCWLGRQLGIRPALVQLIAAGTSICGASAVVATNTVVDGRDEDVAYAVTVVTVFGTVSMLMYPIIAAATHLTPVAFGVWSGASIHEVAQVVAAAFQGGQVSGELATIAKLSRVLFLIPMMLMLGVATGRSRRRRSAAPALRSRSLPIPWFIVGFIGLVGLNSVNLIPAGLKAGLISGNTVLLTVAIAAMGLETNLLQIKQTGVKPLYLGAAAWLFISCVSFMLINAFY